MRPSSASPAQLVPVAATGASIWARGRLRPMPEGLTLGVPTRWWPLVRSGILGPGGGPPGGQGPGPPPPRRRRRAPGTGRWRRSWRQRLGRPVVDRLADPLIGGIHAGSVDDLSAAATFPLLLAASQQPGSLMRRLGSAGARAERSGPGAGTAGVLVAGRQHRRPGRLPGRGAGRPGGRPSATGTSVAAIGRRGGGPARAGRVDPDPRRRRARPPARHGTPGGRRR